MARRRSKRRFSGVANRAVQGPQHKTKRFNVAVSVYREGYTYVAQACPKGPKNRCGDGEGPTLTSAVKKALSALGRNLK